MTGQEADECVARALDEVSDKPAPPVYKPKAIGDMPSAARPIAEYLGSIVVSERNRPSAVAGAQNVGAASPP